MKDYYNVLGIPRGASHDEIKKAYREKAQKYHPDKGGDEAKFKEVNEAYQILGNPDKRKQYDMFGTSGDGGPSAGWDFSSPAGGFGFNGVEFDLGDIFGDFFGGGEQKTKRYRRSAAYRGRDIGVTLEVTLEEAFHGITKDIELRKLVRCERCKGDGNEPGSGRIKCKTCDGLGEFKKSQRTIFGVISHSTICPTCHGEGEYPEQVCRECGGEGRVKKVEKISIPVPVGIESGGILRVQGKGEEGIRGGTAGDLEIKVLVKEHPMFERKGSDLYSEAEISFVQAAIGSSIDVKTIDGKVELKIPAGTQSGTVFKLRGKGMPFSASHRGDSLVKVRVRTPKKLSSKAQKVLKDIAEEL